MKRMLALFMALTLVAWVRSAEPAWAVRIGIFAYQGEEAAVAEWAPLAAYLAKALPRWKFELENFDAEGLRQAVAEGRLDFVITNPGYYITLETEFGISRIATLDAPQTVSSSQAIGSVVLTRADRHDLKALADLQGQRVAAVAPEAFAGYLIAARELHRAGVEPDMVFLGLPMDNLLKALREGAADAAIVKACWPERMARQGLVNLAEFRVLDSRVEPGLPCALSTPLYPDWPIAVTRRTDRALAKAVASALLAEHTIAWTVAADYQPVHDLYRELRVGPYAYLREMTVKAWLHRYWPWLAAALAGVALLLAAWLVHTLRVEQLVQRRSRELRASLAARDAAEQKAREHQERMEHLSRLSILGELSGNLAHEINQPLTSIGTFARAVLRRKADGTLTDAAMQQACDEIAREAERASGIVQRIREFSRKRPARQAPLDALAAASDARQLVLGMLAEPPAVIIEADPGVNHQVLADGLQIEQVLLNLLKNAIDATRGLPPERQAIRMRVERQDRRVVVKVIDQGPGLDPVQRAHLFEAFFTTKPEGLGLGLSICKSIIEAHGGRLWAEENAQGLGMCFAFSLPTHES